MEFFSEIDTDTIKNRVIFLDIDGTLTYDGVASLGEVVLRNVCKLKRDNRIYLCSNKKTHNRNWQIAESAGVNYLKTDLYKPNPKLLYCVENKDGNSLLVIGDKILTDGLFAYRIGADFIKVKRLESAKDSYFSKIINKIDDFLAKFFYAHSSN